MLGLSDLGVVRRWLHGDPVRGGRELGVVGAQQKPVHGRSDERAAGRGADVRGAAEESHDETRQREDTEE